MKKKILATVVLTGILGTGLYAACDGSGNKKGMQNGMEGKKSHKMMQKSSKRGHGMMSMLSQLNLTPEQKTQISEIKADIMKKKTTPDVAFTKEGFDKEKFIEIMKQKRENMIESKAEMIDRVYKVLTPKQKEQFIVLMELKKERMASMMNKRMNF